MPKRATAEASLVERLKERTGPVRLVKRGKPYNYPLLWYMKSDGEIVQLQGDPQNRAYYEDKGYTVLRPDEVEQFLTVERPQILIEQRRRAQIITTLRRLQEKNPTVEILADFEVMTTDELGDLLKRTAVATGDNMKVIRGKTREDVTTEIEPAGVELGNDSEVLAAKLERAKAAGKYRGHDQEG